MQNEVSLAVGRFVDGVAADFDAAEIHAAVFAQAVVVVARNKNDARALAGFFQDFLQNVVVGLRPVRATADFPKIDDIANQIARFRFDVLQEAKQHCRLARAHSQMDI